jgi:hypothetical protein
VAHGFQADVVEIDVVAVTELAEWLAEPDFIPVADMVEWFFDAYEGPEQNVAHDSSEGGFQYYKGGPYDARDALDGQFEGALLESIDEAVDLIGSEGDVWVKKNQYP